MQIEVRKMTDISKRINKLQDKLQNGTSIIECADSYNKIKELVFKDFSDYENIIDTQDFLDRLDDFIKAVSVADKDKLFAIIDFNMDFSAKTEKMWEQCLVNAEKGNSLHEAVKQAYGDIFDHEDYGYDYYDIRIDISDIKPVAYITYADEHSFAEINLCFGKIPDDIIAVFDEKKMMQEIEEMDR